MTSHKRQRTSFVDAKVLNGLPEAELQPNIVFQHALLQFHLVGHFGGTGDGKPLQDGLFDNSIAPILLERVESLLII